MSAFIIVLVTAAIGAAIVYVIARVTTLTAGYAVHRSMSSDHKENYTLAYGTFDDFLYKFNQRDDWEASKRHEGSFFTRQKLSDSIFQHTGEIHAGMIRFDNTMMIFKTLGDWIKFKAWQKTTWQAEVGPEVVSDYAWREGPVEPK